MTTPEGSPAGRGWPKVSVIVPTRNRAAYLRMCLDALIAQIYPGSQLEVLVVDNESTDDTQTVVSEAAARARFPIHYFRKDNQGPAVSRNYGAARGTGEFLAFTDSDCLPSPNWLHSGISEIVRWWETGLVCGPIVPISGDGAESLLVHQVDGSTHDDGIYPTANIIYRRSVFEALGGFDEQFGAYSWGPPVGGDDTDLGWRVRRAGYNATFAPMAVVYHQATPMSLKAAMLDPLRVQVIPRLLTLVPELRETFFWRRYFLGRHTAAWYLALLGLFVAPRRPAAIVLALPWLRIFWPILKIELWPPRRLPRLFMKLGVLAEASTLTSLVLAWASIRYRRLVL
jgi:glycosyltransferase involved in cell wall biosynthesis